MGRNVIRLSESRGIVVEAIVALYAERALTTAALAAYVDAPPEVREARQLAHCQYTTSTAAPVSGLMRIVTAAAA